MASQRGEDNIHDVVACASERLRGFDIAGLLRPCALMKPGADVQRSMASLRLWDLSEREALFRS